MLEIGKHYKPYGKLAAIAVLSGERYYFFVKGRSVAMMPSDAVERGVEKEAQWQNLLEAERRQRG